MIARLRAALRLLFASALAVALLPALVAAATAPVEVVTCAAARADGGHLVRLERCGTVDPGLGPERAARNALARVAGALELDPGSLLLSEVRHGPLGTHVSFTQTVGGVPVDGGAVLVGYDAAGAVRIVRSTAQQVSTATDTTPRMTRARVIALARGHVGPATPLRFAPTARLVVARRRLAWRVVVPTAEPIGDRRLLVADSDGTVLEDTDGLWSATGSGLVHDPNPVQATGKTGLRDNGDATNATLDAARVLTPFSGLSDASTKLKGEFADLVSSLPGCSLPYTAGLANNAGRYYDYQRSDDRFEEATTYAAIDGVHRLLTSLGITGAVDRPIPAQVHCIAADDSSYSAADGSLRFGDGGVDDAEDAELVVHEYGHAIEDALVPGFGPVKHTEQRAIGEGFGDVLATMYFLDRGDPSYVAARRFCFAEWDATSYNPVSSAPGSGCLRWTDGTDEVTGADIGAYPGTVTQEHSDGRFWSAAMTCVFQGIGGDAAARDALLRIVVAHHYDLVPDAGDGAFEDSVAALLAADRDLLGGAHQTRIKQCANRRLGMSFDVDTSAPQVTPVVSAAGPEGNAGWSRGDVTVTWAVSDAQSAITTRIGCDNARVSTDTAGRTFSCTAASEGGMRTVSTTIRRDATAPVLTPAVTPNPFVIGTSAIAVPGATDALSGIAAAGCEPLVVSRSGARDLTCSARDVAGNTAGAGTSYTVSPAALRASIVFGAQSLSRARTRGVRLRVSCSRACSATVILRVSVAVGRRLGLARRPGAAGALVGRATAKLTARSDRSLHVRFTPKAALALRGLGRITLRARMTARGSGQTARAASARRTLR